MNNETLVKDLCSRLPYGVVLENKAHFEQTKYSQKIKLTGVSITGRIRVDGLNLMQDSNKYLPYLFPLSCLTEEITVNGKTFIPGKILFGDDDDFGFEIGVTWKSMSIDMINGKLEDICVPLSFYENLNSWHINYRLSPEQFVAVTESNNPYK